MCVWETGYVLHGTVSGTYTTAQTRELCAESVYVDYDVAGSNIHMVTGVAYRWSTPTCGGNGAYCNQLQRRVLLCVSNPQARFVCGPTHRRERKAHLCVC